MQKKKNLEKIVSKFGRFGSARFQRKEQNCFFFFLSRVTSLLSQQTNNPFLEYITGKKNGFENVQRKRQWINSDKSPQPNPKVENHRGKVMMCVWWNRLVIIQFYVLKGNETLNAHSYVWQLQGGHENLVETHPALVNRKNVSRLSYDARVHGSRITQKQFWNSVGLFKSIFTWSCTSRLHVSITKIFPLFVFALLNHIPTLDF